MVFSCLERGLKCLEFLIFFYRNSGNIAGHWYFLVNWKKNCRNCCVNWNYDEIFKKHNCNLGKLQENLAYTISFFYIITNICRMKFFKTIFTISFFLQFLLGNPRRIQKPWNIWALPADFSSHKNQKKLNSCGLDMRSIHLQFKWMKSLS